MQKKIEDINYLEMKIKQAEQQGEPVDRYVLREIEWLKQQLEQFLEHSEAQGADIEHDISIAEIEIRQYATMRQLAQKIGLSVDEYDAKIKAIKIRLFGEENYKNLFE